MTSKQSVLPTARRSSHFQVLPRSELKSIPTELGEAARAGAPPRRVDQSPGRTLRDDGSNQDELGLTAADDAPFVIDERFMEEGD